MYQDLANDLLYRVVHTGYGQPNTYLVRLDSSRLVIRSIPTDEFKPLVGLNATATGGFVLEDDPYADLGCGLRTTPAHAQQSETNYGYIKDLVNRDSQKGRHQFVQLLKAGAARARIIDEHAENQKVQPKTIRTYFRLWLQRGMTPRAVISGYPNSGRSNRPAATRREYQNHPGRRAEIRRPQTLMPSESRDRLFRWMADLYYTHGQAVWDAGLPEDPKPRTAGKAKNTRPSGRGRAQRSVHTNRKRGKRGWNRGSRDRPTAENVVDRANYLLRCERLIKNAKGEATAVELREHSAISVEQFRHYLRDCDGGRRKRHSMGEAQFRSQGRTPRGHALQHCRGPGHVFMIDATIADVYLVSCFDRTLVVGRPTVYFVVDLWSRMIVGLQVSFRPPSFEGAALALENMVSPKDEFCAQYGFTITVEDWPCEHLPARFHCDRGCEYKQSLPWKHIGKVFAVGIDNSAAFEPFWRGVIERRFGIIPLIAQRHGYGIVEAYRDAPRNFNCAVDALWTRSEFIRELLRAIHLYHRTPISGEIYTPEEMVTGGTPNTPLERWNWGVNRSLAMLQACAVDDIRHAVLFETEATVTSSGLRVNNADYNPETATERYATTYGKASKQKVGILYNPDEMSQIDLSPRNEFPQFANLAGTNRHDLHGATTTEWEQFCKLKRKSAGQARQDNEGMRMLHALNSNADRHRAMQQQDAALKVAGRKRPDATRVKDAKKVEATLERTLPAVPKAENNGRAASVSAAARLQQLTDISGSRLLSDPGGRRTRR
ncbi:DDE-type integrase/transposase/recombinase [Paraburkholderia sp. RAU2J]|uniref:DDE-type integrase/transposase/recombinase n=1 Tax=Paraburkholderia sp. RAU2J TaxID=1938810 RepID=UPI0013151F8D|nr:DDE-type integrase/transposase/recombinase [Paraburkholderia sp. RAU2J]